MFYRSFPAVRGGNDETIAAGEVKPFEFQGRPSMICRQKSSGLLVHRPQIPEIRNPGYPEFPLYPCADYIDAVGVTRRKHDFGVIFFNQIFSM